MESVTEKRDNMATMKKVAELAGVSVATVSRYINKSGYVGRHTKVKIQEIIDELNYTPNEVARSLYQKKSRFIGLLLPDITNPFFTMLSKGVEDQLNESEYGLILANVNNDKDKEREYLNNFKSNNIAGIISAIEHKTDLYKDLLNVSIDRPSDAESKSVSGDDIRGGQIAAEEIIKRSPKEIFILNSTEHLVKSKLRLEGMLSVLEQHEVPYHIHNVKSYKAQQAVGLIDIILNDYPNVDSVIAANDMQAMTILKEAVEKGLNVPNDLQIIGYDNITFSNLTTPGLSTVSQPIYEMGKIGAILLLQMINKEEITENNIKLPVDFINRGSLREIQD